ncbi:MAG: hypothetical protein GEU99_01395 [Luteitalea sp.]|nr:hypothetical protein [Luteitalea sp.]
MFRILTGALLLIAASLTWACQEATDPEDLADPVDLTAPITVNARDGGDRTYTIQRGDDPAFDEVRQYDHKVTFDVTSALTNAAVDEDEWDLELPLTITSASVKVEQASGGIATPPTGSEVVHQEYTSQSSGSVLPEVGSTVTQTFTVWYWLPNRGTEALITVSYTFSDDDGATASDSVDVLVSP